MDRQPESSLAQSVRAVHQDRIGQVGQVDREIYEVRVGNSAEQRAPEEMDSMSATVLIRAVAMFGGLLGNIKLWFEPFPHARARKLPSASFPHPPCRCICNSWREATRLISARRAAFLE